MKVEEAIEKLTKIVEHTNVDSDKFVDLEVPHAQADEILLQVIEENVQYGGKIVELYNKIEKWYS